MANFNVITVARGKDDPPFNPYVYIVPSGQYKTSSEIIMLTPHLMTEVEIDEAINSLIEDLEKVRKKAKRDLQNAQKKRFKSMPGSGIKSER
jgi:hypothetical protein